MCLVFRNSRWEISDNQRDAQRVTATVASDNELVAWHGLNIEKLRYIKGEKLKWRLRNHWITSIA
ncbi:MAG: hypothetical protein JW967_11370 [Dehalococcoidales bacterium]|nr:hypothetical protein [Dehalococcoidales bacterium]